MGRPKALVAAPDGRALVRRGIDVLRAAGCSPVLVVVGARSDEVRRHAAAADHVVEAADWAQGQGASLRAGLEALGDLDDVDAACVLLVDLPDVGAEVVARVVAQAGEEPVVLARAAYDGIPGHPVLAGREHWRGMAGAATGDRGARDYLARSAPVLVECGDLATGRDVDTPADLA
jgi:CTP:molybdopterin cytidylyltransferase MocA